MKRKFFAVLIMVLVWTLAGMSFSAKGQARKIKAGFARDAEMEQPLYTAYKGVRLGMTTAEARAKLGAPALKGSDQDYYVFSDTETAQIAYDAAGKVVTISVDYLGGAGAPDPKTVVGGEPEQQPNGHFYRIVRYESHGFLVSYNRSTGTMPLVTITIQKM
jgi:hypothetical protein